MVINHGMDHVCNTTGKENGVCLCKAHKRHCDVMYHHKHTMIYTRSIHTTRIFVLVTLPLFHFCILTRETPHLIISSRNTLHNIRYDKFQPVVGHSFLDYGLYIHECISSFFPSSCLHSSFSLSLSVHSHTGLRFLLI